jgi:hypothetical protein
VQSIDFLCAFAVRLLECLAGSEAVNLWVNTSQAVIPAHPKGISYGAKAGIQYLPLINTLV